MEREEKRMNKICEKERRMTFFVHDAVELIGKHVKIRTTMKKNMGTEIAASSRRFHNSQVSHACIIHLKMEHHNVCYTNKQAT